MMKLDTAYWEVRQAIAITAYFGGLRVAECMNLALEKIIRGPEGFTITHTRAKQRSDKRSTLSSWSRSWGAMPTCWLSVLYFLFYF